MKALIIFSFLSGLMHLGQTNNLRQIRTLYSSAPLVKSDAYKLEELLSTIDTNAAPVLTCYKGASTMIQAKYVFNPFTKFEKFIEGKDLITKAVNRDTLDLEMRFIRFSIQSNLPSFLGYREEIGADKKFLLIHVKDCRDKELKKIVSNYLSSSNTLTKGELKQLNN